MRLHPSPFQPLADNCPPSRPSWKPCDASSEKGCQDASQPPGLSPQLPANAKLRLAREYPTESRKMRHKRLWPGPFSTNNRHLRTLVTRAFPLPTRAGSPGLDGSSEKAPPATANPPRHRSQSAEKPPLRHKANFAQLQSAQQKTGFVPSVCPPRTPRPSRRAPSHPRSSPYQGLPR